MLRGVPLFAGLDEKDLKTIAESGREVFFESGKTMLRKGESGLAFLLVLDGSVEVRKDGKSIAKLGKGQFFGEMTVIDDQPRSADVVATQPTNCFGLTAWSFDAVISSYPSIARQIMKELVRRLRQVQSSVE